MSRGYNALMRWWLNVPLMDTEAGCKFFRRESILPILDRVVDQRWFWDTEIMVHAHAAGLRMIEIPALFERRADKISSVKILRDSLRHFGNLVRFGRFVWNLKNGPRS
jgi:glycosyltransferase AglD